MPTSLKTGEHPPLFRQQSSVLHTAHSTVTSFWSKYNLYIIASLSVFDTTTDVAMIVDFYNTNEMFYSTCLLSMLVTTLFFSLVMMYL